jgi:hypothetical protein
MSESVSQVPPSGDVAAPSVPVDSPPPAPMPAQDAADDAPRRRLHQLAHELMRSHNRRLVIEYLRLRRAFQ